MITKEDILVDIKVKDDDLKKGGRTMRWFKMEMLGVMFFGMAMQRVFSNMLKPAAETFGLFQLWGTTMQVLFLPIMQLIVPLLINMMVGLMNLPEPLKIVIGAFALLGLVFGTILAIWGQLSLGWGSLMKALSGIGGVIQSVIAWFGALSAAVVIVFAVILAIIAGFIMAWKTNFGKIQEWVMVVFNGIKNIFSGVFNFIVGLLNIVVGIFTLNWDKIKEGWIQAWNGIKSFTTGIVQVIVGIVSTIGLSVLRIIVAVINGAISLLNKIPGVNIAKISTGTTAGFEKEVTKASNVQINQEVKIETKSSQQDIDAALKRANDDLLREIRRNTT